ncbi:hypothetical protein ACKWTF_006953 [Chironomus riparius]
MCVYNVLIVFAVLCVTRTINCVDWTLNCSIGCHCKWMNGKKSALCNSLNLTQLPVNLSTEIQVLMMNENNIQTLNREEFTTLGLINLQKIFLKKSNIKYLHRETFKDLKILVELDLSENQIEQLDKQTFAGNDRLRILLLYGNPIKKLIADQFPSLPYLRTIDLHSCDIYSIDETSFSNVELLEYIDLKQNQLQNLPGLVFNHMKNLKTLLLDENPWNCDCKLKSFRNWYVKNNLNRISLQCKSPYSLLDQHWENIHEDAFGCAPILKILNEDVSLSDLESNITFKCYTTGDPPPTIGWYLDGKEIDNDNVVIDNDDPMHSNNNNPSLPQVSSVAINSNNIAVSGINNNIISINNNINNNNINNNNIHGNSNGYASQNVSLLLPEVGYEHVLIKNNDNFWYFGLVVGIFGTITFFLLISIVFCVCRKVAMRRRIKKNIKGSVSFNDQEKKLLDLSITTTNDRDRDYGDMLNTPSSATNKTDSSIIALEPVQITIENFHHQHNLQHHLQQHHRRMGDEYNPYNQSIALFPPPPPEFCTSATTTQSSLSAIAGVPTSTTSSSIINGQLYQQEQHLRHNLPPIVANATGNSVNVQNSSSLQNQPPYGNIFISVSLTQDSLDNDLNMYPDLLNIVPNRMKSSSTANNLSTSSLQQSSTNVSTAIVPTSQIVPINIESYATLPRNKLLNAGSKTPVSILKQTKKNYDKPRMFETDVDCMAGLIISSSGVSADINNKCVSCSFKSDNMGLRVTASGNTSIGGTAASSLSIPDEELEDEEELLNHDSEQSNHHLTSAPYHHQTEEFEQLSPLPQPKANQQPASGAILMPNDFVSL